ncbi:MAG TPA: MarR family transcriptional regulator [Thermoleophilaceae bacterium]|nr:MarR family transcriptional regulator [Thermoleophilaceae bacterium]
MNGRHDQANEVAAALPQHVARLTRLFWQHSSREISRTGAGVLSSLSARPRRITELAELEGLAQPTVTVMVGKLEERGLVARQRDAGDGRVVLVTITDAGRALLERLRAEYREVLRSRVASMTDDQVAALIAATETLGTLIDALQQGD